MAEGYFRFKQFTVWHDRCAMKVGTDGVLLGAWAAAENVHRVLDVGCGSGLIALMLAQRFTHAAVVAVEIDGNAALQARENVSSSPWESRIEVVQSDFRAYTSERLFDLIVSNPPYFVDSLLPPSKDRSLARHATGLNYEVLFSHGRELLAEDGRFCVILPAELESLAVDAAFRHGLHADRKLCVYTKQGKPLRRVLLSFSTSIEPCTTEILCLMNADGSYSEAYKTLTGDFYIK